MRNIFKDAYFGKQYKLKNGKKAVYIDKKYYHYLIIEGRSIAFPYNTNGSSHGYDELDAVSEWKEPINEEELDKMAIEECDKLLKDEVFTYNGSECVVLSDAEKCWKLGYCQGIKK